MTNSFVWSWLTVALVTALVLSLYELYRKREKRGGVRGARVPRGSNGWPFIGESLDFISCALSSKPESFVDKRRILYGKVFKTHLFGAHTILSSDVEVSRFILHSDAKTFVPDYPSSLMELMGKSSILVCNGDLQRRVHGLVGYFLKSGQLRDQVTSDLVRRMDGAMKDWKDGEVVLIQDQAKSILFPILVKALIGLEPGNDMHFIRYQFQEFVAGLISFPIKLPGSQLQRSLQAKKRIAAIIKRILQKKRNNIKGRIPRDAIDVLISDNNDELTDELISDNMVDFMIPAEDSVPVLITLVIKYLSECPRALHQLEDENMKLKNRKLMLGENLSWTDYLSLSFTQDVISESLRMGNVIVSTWRKAVRDVEIKGLLIPKGWRVISYLRFMHLAEENYKDPYEFNPWRWRENDINRCSFMPFGAGQRLCPGMDLARLEAAIFLHHLVTNFTWVAEEDQVVNFPTVRMKGGMPIRAIRKKQAVQMQ
ncbi:cytochrome P450 90D2-like isoform X1 [Carex littledalei]|uniref:Cytochrome P450 90D2 n=1 Tax=Carex littledalei TaxID=544730 RepID=A0A833R4L2_9POAL|nr:cytochrome P450 90D2-like isoform X1 [Carex littledalei]